MSSSPPQASSPAPALTLAPASALALLAAWAGADALPVLPSSAPSDAARLNAWAETASPAADAPPSSAHSRPAGSSARRSAANSSSLLCAAKGIRLTPRLGGSSAGRQAARTRRPNAARSARRSAHSEGRLPRAYALNDEAGRIYVFAERQHCKLLAAREAQAGCLLAPLCALPKGERRCVLATLREDRTYHVSSREKSDTVLVGTSYASGKSG